MAQKPDSRTSHVCLVCGAYPPVRCGVGDYTARLAQACVRAGARVSVVTSANVPAAEEASGIRVVPAVTSWSAGGTPVLGRCLQNLRPDSVHVMVPSLGYGRGWAPHLILGWLAENLPTCQRVLTLHEYAMYSPLGRWRLQGALRAAHKVVCTNHRDRRVLRHRQALPGKVRVIPLGSVVAPTARSQRPDVFSGSSRRLVHFGTVMPNKGWETLLPAWQQLQQGGGAWQLEAVGALEPEQYAYHAAVAREIERRGLSAAVHFTGYLGHQQVRAAFKNSLGVAVLPFHGGAALNRSSLVTALCAGLAVVSTRPAQPLEGLRHGEHFWLVEPGDPRGLAAGIRRVAQDAQLRRHLQAGARRAAQRFAWPRIAAQTLGLVRGAS